MTASSSDPQLPVRQRWWRRHKILAVVLGLAVLVFAYVAVTFVQVWHAARQDDAQSAQAIIVLGAAQFDGRPSNVLQARLDHAADLYERKLAPLIVVTGGSQPGDRFTEAAASAKYLEGKGVPAADIELETTSTNSRDELAAAARFLHKQGINDVLLVSDGFHAYRIDAIAGEVGLDAHVSPTPTSPVKGFDELRAEMRETVAVAAGRIIGYDRLDRWLGR
ncbi:MAG TPA: YdcF family protein [Acidimicrobiales bacterium]|jgi:uncharacterized SAM-binding protein YcdF (DUF218 family)